MQDPANPEFEWSGKYLAEEEEISNESLENSEELYYNNEYGEEEEEEFDGELYMFKDIEDVYEAEEEFAIIPDIMEPVVTDIVEQRESIKFVLVEDSYSKLLGNQTSGMIHPSLNIPKALIDQRSTEDVSSSFFISKEPASHKSFVIEPTPVGTQVSSAELVPFDENRISLYLPGTEADASTKMSLSFSRNDWILLCEKQIVSRRNNKLKNAYLQRKMTNFFKRKKMEYVLHESMPNVEELLINYHNKLNVYEKSLNEFESLQSKIEDEIELLTKSKDDKLAILNTEFSNLQKLEYEHGSELRTAQRGNHLPKEVIEKLIRRQKEKMEELATERLKYLKIRNKTTEMENKNKCLENIGQGLSISYYEGILAENNTLTDKLEEYADYLEKQRYNCNTCVQILAHVRERVHATNVDISLNAARLKVLTENVKTLRRRLADKASARLLIFRKKSKLKHENCLLLNKDLFSDYCDTVQKIETNNIELELLKEETEYLHAQKVSLTKKKEAAKKKMTNVAST